MSFAASSWCELPCLDAGAPSRQHELHETSAATRSSIASQVATPPASPMLPRREITVNIPCEAVAPPMAVEEEDLSTRMLHFRRKCERLGLLNYALLPLTFALGFLQFVALAYLLIFAHVIAGALLQSRALRELASLRTECCPWLPSVDEHFGVWRCYGVSVLMGSFLLYPNKYFFDWIDTPLDGLTAGKSFSAHNAPQFSLMVTKSLRVPISIPILMTTVLVVATLGQLRYSGITWRLPWMGCGPRESTPYALQLDGMSPSSNSVVASQERYKFWLDLAIRTEISSVLIVSSALFELSSSELARLRRNGEEEAADLAVRQFIERYKFANHEAKFAAKIYSEALPQFILAQVLTAATFDSSSVLTLASNSFSMTTSLFNMFRAVVKNLQDIYRQYRVSGSVSSPRLALMTGFLGFVWCTLLVPRFIGLFVCKSHEVIIHPVQLVGCVPIE
eukprot:gnl/TRDRNA2_/TRDRNA2_203877_c0_seq1.p1 gnl/TRDRNA2_/TRDRNA2_203877_c0~~gnl/TRDRNA2_/TRDRNA2_203877_c0_seq1.p1  ORF type:complete len:460 (+),score=39.40 gnl/TRDRNA2_/TRDRNA2_203877_c0_seq1:31-1380(+)